MWEVEDHFIAATSLESAIDHFCGNWGIREREGLNYDDTHCDRCDYYADIEAEDGNPTSSMRVQAEILIDAGSVMPFEFARAE